MRGYVRACPLSQLPSCGHVPRGRLAAQRLLDVLVAQSSTRARLAPAGALLTSRSPARAGVPWRVQSEAFGDRGLAVFQGDS